MRVELNFPGGIAKTPATVPSQNAEQLALALAEIADAAHSINRLATLLTVQFGDDEADDRDTETYIACVEALAQRIGVIADRSNAGTIWRRRGTNPEDWMMPPAWHGNARELGAATKDTP